MTRQPPHGPQVGGVMHVFDTWGRNNEEWSLFTKEEHCREFKLCVDDVREAHWEAQGHWQPQGSRYLLMTAASDNACTRTTQKHTALRSANTNLILMADVCVFCLDVNVTRSGWQGRLMLYWQCVSQTPLFWWYSPVETGLLYMTDVNHCGLYITVYHPIWTHSDEAVG